MWRGKKIRDNPRDRTSVSHLHEHDSDFEAIVRCYDLSPLCYAILGILQNFQQHRVIVGKRKTKRRNGSEKNRPPIRSGARAAAATGSRATKRSKWWPGSPPIAAEAPWRKSRLPHAKCNYTIARVYAAEAWDKISKSHPIWAWPSFHLRTRGPKHWCVK